jgi:formylglycine-generating enzyme required for sulfatase activity
VVFEMGSPLTEAEREGGPKGTVEIRHRRRIGRSFAIAAKEVTVGQFLRFRPEHRYNDTVSPTREHPVNTVTWYEAAAYCNWLSKQEGIPEKQWCYLPNDKGEFADGMRLKPNYLQLEGYRLPSEAEWECACRAGAVTARPYGETEALLRRYAWYLANSANRGMLAVGSLRPNDLGLFDLLGNALEWCQDSRVPYPASAGDGVVEDVEDTKEVKDNLSRDFRGGSFRHRAAEVRCADRNEYLPTLPAGGFNIGFRPARTIR